LFVSRSRLEERDSRNNYCLSFRKDWKREVTAAALFFAFVVKGLLGWKGQEALL
jgi:hypothetical protein